MNNKNSIHIVVLKDNELTNRNIQTGIANSLWGMQFKGKHVGIKKGDLVLFLLGISFVNLSSCKKDSRFEGVFPNIKDSTLQHIDFIQEFEFNVNKAILGRIESDYFEDDTIVWPPITNKAGKENFFPHRFYWKYQCEKSNFNINGIEGDDEFQLGVIKAVRDKGAQPTFISSDLLSKYKSQFEEDESLNQEESFQNATLLTSPIVLNKGPRKKQKQSNYKQGRKWPRSPAIAAEALKSALFKCEVSELHATFIHPLTNNNFVEGHHFIPISQQENFEYSLDVPENILSLCPNCHRAFHFSSKGHKKELIKMFYSKRIEKLNDRGINISFEKMVGIYEE